MANGANGRSGRPVPASRKAVAVPICAVGAFVAVAGLGMRSWQVFALGVAVLVLAFALVFVPALRGGSRVYVTGTGHVVSVSEPPASSVYGRCEMQLVVEAPSMPPAAVRVLDSRVPVAKWPDPGATLPILVAMDDLRRVRVQWDDVLTHAEVADYREPGLLGPEPPAVPGPDTDLSRARGGSDTVFLSPEGEPIIPTVHPAEQPPGGYPADQPTGGYPEDQPTGGYPADQPPAPRQRRPSPYPEDDEALTTTAVLTDPIPDEPEEDVDDVPGYPGARPDAAGSVLGVGLTVLVSDLDRSVAFYRDTLGFHQLDRGDGNAVLASGDTRMVLRQVKDVQPINRRVMQINLEVGDVRAMYEALRDGGVRFIYGPRLVNRGERLELWQAAFKDPDGHGVALAQWHHPAPESAVPRQAAPPDESAPEPTRTRGPIHERLSPETANQTANQAPNGGPAA